MASYEYTIGANGERLSCTELGRTVEYTYDALERLTSETVTVGSDVSVTTYTYDSNSNRLSMTRDGEVTNYTYNSLNQITQAGDVSYTWDNAGNLVSQSRNGVIAATYTYDCHNRMISANVNSISGNIVESYTYDYLGNRTSKTTDGETTYFTIDLSSGYSQVLKAETGSEIVYYTRGFELISRRVGQEALYYLFDGGMSVRCLTDETGAITDTFVFDAFGNEVARTGTTDNSYGFQGEEKDATGLYYLRARYMDPSTGTFTSMDTYGGSLSDSMSLHKYLFANSNPIKYCDPSGHFTLAEMELTLSLDNILMSATLNCFAYCGVVGNDPSIDSGSALSGYFVSILLSLIIPVMAAILLAVCSLLICMITFGVVAVLFGGLAIGMSAKGDTVSAYICGQIAGEAIGALVTSLVRYAFAKMAVTKPGMKTVEELQDMLQEYVSTDTDVQSRRPTCVSVAYDTATGTPYYGCSGGFGTPNPTLQEMVPSVSYEDWNNVLNCAEMDAVNNALNDGAYSGYLEIVTITRRSGDVRNMCSNCFYSFAGNAYTPTESGFVGLSR